MSNIKTIEVAHLGGIRAAYQMPHGYDSSKPTLALINSHRTTSDLYKPQFDDDALGSSMNLIAIEPLGHGQTRAKSEQFTFWDTAIMNLQVLEALGIERWFVLGTSQGGWVAVRMALLAPEKCAGALLLGTSMDYESPRSTALGCWDGYAANTPIIEALTTSTPTPDFVISDETCKGVLDRGFGPECKGDAREFWIRELKKNYSGDDGRKRLRMAAINLRDRDGLHGRLADVKCPILWLHGTADQVYSVKNAQEEIKLFVNAPEARLETIQGGQHFLSWSHPTQVNEIPSPFDLTCLRTSLVCLKWHGSSVHWWPKCEVGPDGERYKNEEVPGGLVLRGDGGKFVTMVDIAAEGGEQWMHSTRDLSEERIW